MSQQSSLSSERPRTSPGWLQRLATSLGFASAATLRETVETAIAEADGDEDASLSPQERAMLLNLLGFGGTRVSDMMVPRADIRAIAGHETVASLLALFARTGHSRVPVYNGSLDNPIGMVHIKDAIAWATKNASRPVAEGDVRPPPSVDFTCADLSRAIVDAGIVRDALFVPPSMPALALLAKMRAKQTHLALVVDEFGGTDGLVTLEDLIEEIIGDVEDEHDFSMAPRIDADGEAFLASARAPVEAVEQALGVSLIGEDADDVNTLGGVILTMAGSVPKRGEIVRHPSGIVFEIVDAGPRRLHTIRIFRQKALPSPDAPILLAPPTPRANVNETTSNAQAA